MWKWLISMSPLQETFGIMGEPATAMRDPVFYRFHAFTDDVFLELKNTLPEYSLQQVGVRSCPVSSTYPSIRSSEYNESILVPLYILVFQHLGLLSFRV